MKIALLSARRFHTPPRTIGGTERAVHNLGRALAELGHDVTVWAKPGSDPQGAYDVRPYDGGRFEDWDRLASFDVVHNHWVGDDNWTGFRFLTKLLKVHPHVVQTYHGMFPYYVRPYAWFLRFRSRKPYFVVQSTRALEYGRRHRVPNCHLIFNAVSGMSFGPSAQDYLLYLGRLEKHKGVPHALKLAQASGQRLIIAGPGSSEFVERTVRPALTERIEYRGEVSDEERMRLFQGARVLLFPSRYGEGTPLVVLEAILSGTPVLSSDAYWSAPDLIVPGVTGFLCRNEADWLRAISRVQEIDRRACHEWGVQRFSPRVIAQKHLELYEQFMGRSGPPRTQL